MSEIQNIDKNLATTAKINDQEIEFFSVRNEPFTIYGLISGKEGELFRRMPEDVAEKTSPGVRYLHTNTAGGRVRFRTDSECVAIRAVMPGKCLMSHMPFVGSSGFDVYVSEGEAWYYKGSLIPPTDRKDSYEALVHFGHREMREVTIHFPLYDNVEDLYVGIEPGASLEKGAKYRSVKPFICYGSSITQGGCASRPGNCYSNILSRKLNMDHINLGFSGNAKGEQVMADYIAQLPMSVFLMDYDHNAPSIPHLEATHEKFFLTIREKNPDLPIIMATKTDTARTNQLSEALWSRREIILRTYENAVKRGDKLVKFVDGRKTFDEISILGIPADSCTVDGCHPNDLGFACMAKVFEQAIREMQA